MAEGFFGINSNFDSAGIIDSLIALERQPIDLTIAKQELEELKLASFEDLEDRLRNFRSIVTTLNTESRFIETKGIFTNNDASAVTEVVDIVTTSSATSGTFSFNVNQLAKETKLASEGFESINSTVPPGTLEITVGDTTTSIAINATNNTLAGLRLAINNSGADVQANFLDDGSDLPTRLTISGTRTGTENEVTLKYTSPVLGGTFEGVSFTETQAAQDAIVEVDGISVVKSSNTLTDVLPNSILTLLSEGEGTVSLSNDIDEVKDKIDDFVEGFNDLMTFLNEELAVDENDETTGLLFGNFTVQNLQQNLRNIVSSEVIGANGQFKFLSQIGIRTSSDGTLTVDDSELTDALATDIENVSQLFSSKGTTTNSNVTFIGFTEETAAGTYDIRVSGGVPQLRRSGESEFVSAEGSGNFYSGAEGSSGEGLNFRIADNISDGNFGTINLSIGVAEQLNRKLVNLTDLTRNGPLATELDTVRDSIDDFEETIIEQEERLVLFEDNIRARFINLEQLLGTLETQRQALTNSLQSISNLRPNTSR